MTRYRDLYSVEDLPIFQNRMYASEHEAIHCPKGNMRLVEDLDTGLLYNLHFEPDQMVYDEHYQNDQSSSSIFLSHLDEVAGIIGRTMQSELMLEIGCGKGRFMDLLLDRGFNIIGVDPTYEGDSDRVIKSYFTKELNLRGDGIILRHVLEHIQNPFDFLCMVRDANGGSGKIYIEVPCFDWICSHNAWFDIFYEHVNYFRETDFHRMFGTVYESGKVFSGQYIYVLAELSSLQRPVYDPQHAAQCTAGFFSQQPELPAAPSQHQRRIVWGAASKGVIFSLMSKRRGQPVDTIIDISPAKQGRYIPATGLRVHAPDAVLPTIPDGSIVHVMNSNYMDEIKAMSQNRFVYEGIDNVLS